ncbi:LRP2 [Mytilus coruscus]|uniref:LRP2 n=1 Tax=Mytilus coruscus TaxID=42192 RepID=A0A6J8A3N1_MYTCO|nr:LRP2 [Mytilus coruscus]
MKKTQKVTQIGKVERLNHRKCPNGQVKCRNNIECIHEPFICNGVMGCTDRSDEDEEFCKDYKCLDHQVKCRDNIECISKSSLCDIHIDCYDDSDEDEEFCKAYPCKDHWKKCEDNVQCLHITKFCDGAFHCSDGSDEVSETKAKSLAKPLQARCIILRQPYSHMIKFRDFEVENEVLH